MRTLERQLQEYGAYRADRRDSIDLDELTSAVVGVGRPQGSQRGWLVAGVAAVLVVLFFGVVSLWLGSEPETGPADTATPTTVPTSSDTVVPTTDVDATPTTQMADPDDEPALVGDDEIVLAMAQSFPLIPDPEFAWTDGPDEASGQTARLWLPGETTDPGVDENHRQFGVHFVAFDNEQLASEFIEDMLIQDPTSPGLILEVFILRDLGDEAAATFSFNRGRGNGSGVFLVVRRGRFVAQVVSEIDIDLDADTVNSFDAANYPVVGESVARLTGIAEIADESMQTVLSSDMQPLPAPQPETLTSYEMNVFVYQESADPTVVHSIVTPEGYGCLFSPNEEAQPGVAEIGEDAFEQVDWNGGWFPSTTDSLEFQSGKDFCQTWSPQLDESYLGDLIRLQEGHVGTRKGRRTLSYWFTKDDLIEADVLTASDNIEIKDFRMIVDQAGPWLVSLWISFEGDAEAVGRLVRFDLPDLETVDSLSIDIGYGIIDDGTETWADRLDAWIQPRP